MSENQFTKLTKPDLQAIENRFAVESQSLGDRPTIDDLLHAGYAENETLNDAIEFIQSAGRIIILFVAETIQSLAVLIIAVVFAVLEFWRVHAGAIELGQAETQASLIAFAVVTANIVHPIYVLRSLRGSDKHVKRVWTLRGSMLGLWERIAGLPSDEHQDWNHNPTLHFASVVITWTTVVLAVYDLIAPILISIFEGTATKPMPILIVELLMGIGLSVAGVFFLQSVAHEIGVRTLTDKPQRLTDILESKQAEYDAKQAELRASIIAEYQQAKISDKARDDHSKRVKAEHGSNGADFLQNPLPAVSMNGNGNH